MSEFKVPRNVEIYISNVRDRCSDLIRHGIWTGLDNVDINSWLKNFKTIEERYFSACILDYLIYRSYDQTEALAYHLFTKSLLSLAIKIGLPIVGHKGLIDILRSSENPKIRIVAVISRKDRPSKSSEVILRMFRRGVLNFNDALFIKPDEVHKEVNNGIENFIFIDDFLGTGEQFLSFYKEYGLELTLSEVNSIYAPLVAHEQGIKLLQDNFSELKIAYGELLKKKYNVFETAFKDEINTPEIARSFYLELLDKHNFNLSDEIKFGHGNLGLAYGFSHAVPDNNLDILWNNNSNWAPLFRK